MAPLYKRYYPPDDEQIGGVTGDVPQQAIGLGLRYEKSTQDKKRKWEGHGQEIQRKAPKSVRRKTETILEEGAPREEQFLETEITSQRHGEFAHIRSTKRRHKLEREARKARKYASRNLEFETVERPGDLSSSQPVSSGTVSTRIDGLPDEKTNRQGLNEGSELISDEIDLVIRSSQEGNIARQEEISVSDDLSREDEVYSKKHASILHKFHKSKQRPKLSEDEHVPQAKPSSDHGQPSPIKSLEPFALELEDHVPVKSFSALPSWLSRPTIISQTQRRPFKELGLQDDMVQRLNSLGFEDALPVQQALIPELLPPGSPGSNYAAGTESIVPDIAVSAPTGSGKTLAYLLPLVESLKTQRETRFGVEGLVVVPTRELAAQVGAVAEKLAKGSHLRVGVASGAAKFADEQRRFVNTSFEYDLDTYRRALELSTLMDNPPDEESEEFPAFLKAIDSISEQDDDQSTDISKCMIGHIARQHATVDILICTPGRLLDHLASTKGFNLSSTRWIVLDEADKLIDDRYGGLLARVDEEIGKERIASMRGPRERYLRKQGLWNDQKERSVRKVALSATMTTDVAKLASFGLQRPKLIVVGSLQDPAAEDVSNSHVHIDRDAEVFELPKTLEEFYCPVGDGTQKPILLLRLIEWKILGAAQADTRDSTDACDSKSDDSSGDSTSDSASDTSGSVTSSSSVISSLDTVPSADLRKPPTSVPTILVFVASTESALRLAELLKILRKDLSSAIFLLTKEGASHAALARLALTSPCIVVATDRAGRGLDTLAGRDITHVIQYDVPRSIVSYVHRVGRTARADRGGQAFTLYTHPQGKWFINEIIRASSIYRASGALKVTIEAADEQMVQKYEDALAVLNARVNS